MHESLKFFANAFQVQRVLKYAHLIMENTYEHNQIF